jgi:hypothetical protein
MANRTKVEYSEQDKIQASDHDSLIRLEGKLDQLISDVQNLKNIDIKELKDGTTDKLTDLQHRVVALEFWRTTIISAWGIASAILIFIWFQWWGPLVNEIVHHVTGH